MLQRRRTAVVVLAALLVVYVYNFWSFVPEYGVPAWIREDGNGGAMNSTLGFERIFVINLPSRRDRRDGMALIGAVSHLNLTFIRGLTGESVVLPVGNAAENDNTTTEFSHYASAGARGSWGSHLSALQEVVDLKLGSALVLEDDVDWDVRLKAQMRTFARASRMWLGIKQRKESKAGSLLSSVSHIKGIMKMDMEGDTISLPPQFLSIDGGDKSHNASPYGENWDVLWLGHCGADLPAAQQETRSGTPNSFSSSSSSSSSLKIAIANDTTVPAPKHLQPHPFALHDALADAYPAYTRVVHASRGNVCSLAYAVSQGGARKLIRRFNEDGLVAQWDLMLRDYCSGGDTEQHKGVEEGKKYRESLVCLTVQPPLICHRYEAGGGASVSDIRGQGGGFAREKMGSPYIRLSVQGNLDRLLAGYPEERLVDQLPDYGNTLW